MSESKSFPSADDTGEKLSCARHGCSDADRTVAVLPANPSRTSARALHLSLLSPLLLHPLVLVANAVITKNSSVAEVGTSVELSFHDYVTPLSYDRVCLQLPLKSI